MNEIYYTASPQTASKKREVSFYHRGKKISLMSDTATFSYKQLDPGTKVMIENLPMQDLPQGANILDIGCGYGALSVVLAMEYPECNITAIDVNERALQLTEENARELSLSNISAYKSDAPEPRSLRFDLIYSNPPIRIGQSNLQALLLDWLALLKEGGSAFFVIKRDLGGDRIASYLCSEGYPTARIASKNGYRILEARRLS